MKHSKKKLPRWFRISAFEGIIPFSFLPSDRGVFHSQIATFPIMPQGGLAPLEKPYFWWDFFWVVSLKLFQKFLPDSSGRKVRKKNYIYIYLYIYVTHLFKTKNKTNHQNHPPSQNHPNKYQVLRQVAKPCKKQPSLWQQHAAAGTYSLHWTPWEGLHLFVSERWTLWGKSWKTSLDSMAAPTLTHQKDWISFCKCCEWQTRCKCMTSNYIQAILQM